MTRDEARRVIEDQLAEGIGWSTARDVLDLVDEHVELRRALFEYVAEPVAVGVDSTEDAYAFTQGTSRPVDVDDLWTFIDPR